MVSGLKKKLLYSTIQNYVVRNCDIENQCYCARDDELPAVLVLPTSLPTTDRMLAGTGVKTYVATSYPSGCYVAEAKAEEIRMIVAAGHRVDGFFMVLQVGKLMSGDFQCVEDDIKACKAAAGGRALYVIVEAPAMNEEQLRRTVEIAAANGVDGLALSTGFVPYDIALPTPEICKRVAGIVAGRMEVVAIADIATPEAAAAMVQAGADRVVVTQSFPLNK